MTCPRHFSVNIGLRDTGSGHLSDSLDQSEASIESNDQSEARTVSGPHVGD